MTDRVSARHEVDIRDIKASAARVLPPGDAIRELILAEEDLLPRAEYLAKAETWVRLIRSQSASFGWTEAVHRGQEKVCGEIQLHRVRALVKEG